jgi:hypothetical protein
MKRAQLIKHSGEITEIFPSNGNDFSLQECYDLIECSMVEIIELSDGRVMILDEEGKLKDDCEENILATEMFNLGRPSHAEYVAIMKKKYGNNFIDASMDDERNDMVVGTVIVCSPDMFL